LRELIRNIGVYERERERGGGENEGEREKERWFSMEKHSET